MNPRYKHKKLERSPEQQRVDMEIRQALTYDTWLWKCGLSERNLFVPKDIKALRTSEWSNTFEQGFMKVLIQLYEGKLDIDKVNSFIQLQKNRLVMGAFRYGYLGDKAKPKWDRLKAIEKYFDKYKSTGNAEMIVDISNYFLLEYVEGVNTSNVEVLEEHWVWGIKGGFEDYKWAIDRCIIDYKATGLREHLILGAAFAFAFHLYELHPYHHFEGSDNTDLHCDIKL